MNNLSDMKKVLLMKQEELQQRISTTQATEREETKGGQDDDAQLWETSEIRDGLDDEAAAELGEVNKALVRLDAGQYGTCTSCGKPIGETRLKALPYASLCITCAEAEA